jgi:hypothetical protein
VRFENEKERQIQIYNMNGKLMYENRSINDLEKITTSTFAAGTYIIKSIDLSTNKVESSLFIK